MQNKKLKEDKNSGFGSSIEGQGSRLINHDGSFNVHKTGVPFLSRFSLYHELINMSWLKFNITVVISYIIINTFFALLYLSCDASQFSNFASNHYFDKFLNAFYFSCQTFTTVGYGFVSPLGQAANIIASAEALLGLMGFALATGVLYGRFSKPEARILYSDNALVSPYRDHTGLMFRIANARDSQMTEAQADVIFSIVESHKGRKTRKFYRLKLEFDKINFLATSWTVVHPITESSPLYNLSKKDMEEMDAEILISIKAFDHTYYQMVGSRSSYKTNEILWNAKFRRIFNVNENGKTLVDVSQLSAYDYVS